MIEAKEVRRCDCGFETTNRSMVDCVCGKRMSDMAPHHVGQCVLCGLHYDSDAQPITMFFGEVAHLTCLDPQAFTATETAAAFNLLLLGRETA